ncbi:MAG: FRG domain-containing protein [Endomicrobiales bacterium]|nr:FRG domain-containing protein [Endomicrobiales bacterium]
MGDYWKDYNRGNPVKNWEDIIDAYKKYGKRDWVFRGIRNDSYKLKSTLDRWIENINDQNINNPHKIIKPKDRWKYEAELLYQFKRRAHFYIKRSELPKPEEFLEWFSLMRHYGCPSRMVDFTYSFYVALYSSVFEEGKTNACIFGIDRKWLVGKCDKLTGNNRRKKRVYFQTPAVFYKYAMYHPKDNKDFKSFVIPVRPFISNERIHAQQGLFLCPTNINKTFEANLKGVASNRELKENIVKIGISKRAIPEIVHELKRMNINSETLFPGLSGFSGSLIGLLYTLKDYLQLKEDRLKQAIRKIPEPNY